MTVCYWCGAKDTLADIGKELDDGKYKMVQCSKCKNAYYVVNKEKMNKPKPQTNEEWLHTLNTEHLADVFFEYRYVNATPRQKLWMSASEECIKTDIVEWLKQPHTFE